MCDNIRGFRAHAVRPYLTPDSLHSPLMIYDLAVIGGGTGGLVSAVAAKSLGANVVLIERERVGGECLWTGCVPSKTLIKSAKVFDLVNRAAEFGVHAEKPRALWNAIRLRIKDVQDEIKKLEKNEIAKAGLEIINGDAVFLDANTLRVQTKSGAQTVSAKKFILSIGLQTRVPKIDGLQESGFITNRDVFDLPSLPRTMIILGGGSQGCEFAQAFARLGTKVTLIHRGERLLPREDVEVSNLAHRVLEQSGVAVFTNANVQNVAREDGERAIVAFMQNGENQTAEATRILVATGKVADYSGLKLSEIGVQWDEKGLIVDEHLRTTLDHIWACGDCTGRNLWTHAAEHEAKIAVQNALLPLKKKLDNRVTPRATFLDPECASVGLDEETANIEYSKCKVFRSEFKTLDRAIIEGETQGFCKVVCTSSGVIVGAHIVGASAAELIHPFVAAVRDGMTISEFGDTMHVYPTMSEIAHRIGNDSYRELLDNKSVKWALKKLI